RVRVRRAGLRLDPTLRARRRAGAHRGGPGLASPGRRHTPARGGGGGHTVAGRRAHAPRGRRRQRPGAGPLPSCRIPRVGAPPGLLPLGCRRRPDGPEPGVSDVIESVRSWPWLWAWLAFFAIVFLRAGGTYGIGRAVAAGVLRDRHPGPKADR